MGEVVGQLSLHLPFLLFRTLKELGFVGVQARLLLQRNMKRHEAIGRVLLLKILNRAAKRVYLRFGILPPQWRFIGTAGLKGGERLDADEVG